MAQRVAHVHMLFQSNGGTVCDGVCLYNFFRSLPISLTLYNTGSVAPVAVVAYLGAHERKLDLDTGLGNLIVGQQLTPRDAVVSITRDGFRRADQAALASRTLGGKAMRARLEQRADDAGGGRAQGYLPPILADRHLLETIKVAQHVAPLGPKARSAAVLIQLLAQDQSQEGAEHVTPDSTIRGMGDGPCAHQRLGGAEELLHLDQVAVAQNRLQRCDPGIGAQHEQAVIARLLGQLAGINLKRPRV